MLQSTEHDGPLYGMPCSQEDLAVLHNRQLCRTAPWFGFGMGLPFMSRWPLILMLPLGCRTCSDYSSQQTLRAQLERPRLQTSWRHACHANRGCAATGLGCALAAAYHAV